MSCYWYLLPESSNSDLVCVCRGRFGQHMPILLSFEAAEKPACSVWSNISGPLNNSTLLCCHGPRGTGYIAQNCLGAPIWRIILNHSHCCCVLPWCALLYLGNTGINTEIYIKIKWLACKRLHCLVVQLLPYVAGALQIAALCNWTNVKQN